MSITDELREFAPHLDLGKVALAGWKEGLLAIADRIDAEHQKALDEWKAEHGQMWLKGYRECHAELLEGNETLASDLERCGWVKLPVDADGEPIHIGDVMENIVCPSVHREVTGVGVECFYGWDDGNGRYSQFDVRCYRHHHEQTVEDVLREMRAELDEVTALYVGEAIDSDERDRDEARIFAEYAAKLRLAGDAE
jgi:hypothetical protein